MSHMELHERCLVELRDVVKSLQDDGMALHGLDVLCADLREAIACPPPEGLASNLDRVIAGALRSCIDAHGPITKYETGSAAKRVRKAINGTWKQDRRRRVSA